MTPEQLSIICRCGHARRKHETGTIFVGYSTKCHEFHTGWEDGPDCFYFEPVSNVVMLRRDSHGRFAPLKS